MKSNKNLERGTPFSFDNVEKGAILFLTNNDNTMDLYQWLKNIGEKVYTFQNKIDLSIVEQLHPSFIISFNYRHLIKEEVIEYMDGRIINLHCSYLPYNRGASPNFFSLWDDTPKGVSIHKVDKGLDTGDILCQKELYFDENKETFESTYSKLLEEIKKLFKDNWSKIRTGEIQPREQKGKGTYHKMSELEEIRLRKPFQWTNVIGEYKNSEQ